MILSSEYLMSFQLVFQIWLIQSQERLAPKPEDINVSYIRSSGASNDVLILVSGYKKEIEKLLRKKQIYFNYNPTATKPSFFISPDNEPGLGNLKLLHPLLTTWSEQAEDRPLMLQDEEVLRAIANTGKTKKYSAKKHLQ